MNTIKKILTAQLIIFAPLALLYSIPVQASEVTGTISSSAGSAGSQTGGTTGGNVSGNSTVSGTISGQNSSDNGSISGTVSGGGGGGGSTISGTVSGGGGGSTSSSSTGSQNNSSGGLVLGESTTYTPGLPNTGFPPINQTGRQALSMLAAIAVAAAIAKVYVHFRPK